MIPSALIRDPGGIRTHDPQLRRLLLYPTELLDQKTINQEVNHHLLFFAMYKKPTTFMNKTPDKLAAQKYKISAI